MLMLIFGLVLFIFCCVFVYIYWLNIKSVVYLLILKEEGREILFFKKDIKSLIDGCFYMILMFIFLIGVFLFIIFLLVYMICLVFINYDYNYLLLKSLFDWVGFVNFGNIFSGCMVSIFFFVLFWILIWVVFVIVMNFFFGIIFVLLINIKGLKFKKMWCIIFVIIMVVF